MKKTNWKLLWILILILLGFCLSVRVIEADPPPPTKLDHILNVLAWCESGNNPNALNPKDGGSPSYGLLQWKEASFFYYNEKHKVLPDIERGEVLNIIMDATAQRMLAKEVLQEPNGWRNWYNCLKSRYQ